jgi:hypothetical protein
MGAVNNREKATLIWLAALLLYMLSRPDLRESVLGVLKALVQPAVFGCLLLLAGWTVGVVVVLHRIGLWEPDVRNDTVAWSLTVGFGFFMSIQEVKKPGYFIRAIRRATGLTGFVTVFVNLAVFSLPGELILLPVVTFLVLLAAVAKTDPEHAPALKLVNLLLSALGIFCVVHVGVNLVDALQADHTVRALFLPLWLTLGALPLIYAVGLYSEYEQAFLRIDLHADADPNAARRARRALLRAAHLNVRNLGGFAGRWIHDVATAESKAEARRVMRSWKRNWRRERYEQNFRSAQSSVQDWLEQDDSVIADIHLSVLERQWEELDHLQRAEIKAEALSGPAKDERAKAVAELPD